MVYGVLPPIPLHYGDRGGGSRNILIGFVQNCKSHGWPKWGFASTGCVYAIHVKYVAHHAQQRVKDSKSLAVHRANFEPATWSVTNESNMRCSVTRWRIKGVQTRLKPWHRRSQRCKCTPRARIPSKFAQFAGFYRAACMYATRFFL